MDDLARLHNRMNRLLSAYERAGWKLDGLRDGPRRRRKAKAILANLIDETSDELAAATSSNGVG